MNDWIVVCMILFGMIFSFLICQRNCSECGADLNIVDGHCVTTFGNEEYIKSLKDSQQYFDYLEQKWKLKE